MNEEYTVYDAAAMTARCKSVNYYWAAPEYERYVAQIWCNTCAEYVVGRGPTAWDAVLDAYKKKRS